MTVRRLAGGIAFVVVAAVLTAALVLNDRGARDSDATLRSTMSGCPAASSAAAPAFCVDLGALTRTSERVGPSDMPGLLDQLPACGRASGLLPSFCVELPAATPAATSGATATGSALDACAQLASTEAPIFCLGAVAVPGGPAGRTGVVRYLAQQSGLNTREVDAVGVHLEVDRLIGAADAERLRSVAEADIAAVESYLGQRFAVRPVIFVLATRSSYATALENLLRYTPATAAALATQTGGLYVSDPSVVFVNWENIRGSEPLYVMRHELAHALVREMIGAAATLPAWVDEGLATLVQSTARPSLTVTDRSGYIALALLAQHRTSLDELTSLAEWPTRNAALDGYAYQVAEKAVSALLRRVSLPGLIRIFSAQQQGASFADAYERVSGEAYTSFLASFAREVAACGPGIVVGPAGADRNVSYLVHGFGGQHQIHIIIDAAAYHVAFDVRADQYGTYVGTFGSTAPEGRYELSATDGAMTSHASIDTRPAGAQPSQRVPDTCGG